MYVVVMRFFNVVRVVSVSFKTFVSVCVGERSVATPERERSVKEETRKERRFLFAKSGIG